MQHRIVTDIGHTLKAHTMRNVRATTNHARVNDVACSAGQCFRAHRCFRAHSPTRTHTPTHTHRHHLAAVGSRLEDRQITATTSATEDCSRATGSCAEGRSRG